MIVLLNSENLTLQRRFALRTTLNESPLISKFISSLKHERQAFVYTTFCEQSQYYKHFIKEDI